MDFPSTHAATPFAGEKKAAGEADPPKTGKLRKNISIIYAIVFLALLAIGGFSVYLSNTILYKLHEIEEESRHVVIVKQMYKDVFRLVLAMHHFLIHPEQAYVGEMSSQLSKIETRVRDYIEIEKKEFYEERNIEIDYLQIILSDIDGLKAYLAAVDKEFSRSAGFDQAQFEASERFAYNIEIYVAKINEVHFKKIAEWEEQALSYMRVIIVLFATIFFGGLLAFYIGHRALSRTIVEPIRRLADTTIDFSRGAFDRRARTKSRTEIGQLYQAFNQMAECVQSRDRLLTRFNEDLEIKVDERTLELRKAAEQLQRTQMKLLTAEKISAIGEIATGVAHEIKNPLNSLSINMQSLLREIQKKCGAGGCRFYDMTNLIQYEVRRINTILDNFVSYAKFPEPQFMEHDLNGIVAETAAMLAPQAEASAVRVACFLSEAVPPFRFDRSQIKEVLMNLAQNALHAMPRGGVLTLRTLLQEDSVLLQVSDTGAGIPEKNRDRIFMIFFSTKERGLGLGLAIVKRIVEGHGGRIACTSADGAGTTFDVTLPLQTA